MLDGQRSAQLVVVEQAGEDLPPCAGGQLGERRGDRSVAGLARPTVDHIGQLAEISHGIGGDPLDLGVDLLGQLEVRLVCRKLRTQFVDLRTSCPLGHRSGRYRPLEDYARGADDQEDPMARATVASLSDKERLLVAETQTAALKSLDEDQLLDLHARVRRERTKQVGIHRRSAAAQVPAKAQRSAAPRRSESKAEIFEQALARVSTAVAAAARRAAAELRAERLAAASSAAGPESAAPRPANASSPATAKRAAAKQPVERKAVASSRADGARRQAKRDGRN